MTLVLCVPGYLLFARTEMFTKLCLGGSFLCLFRFARTEIEHRMPCCISISFIQVYFANFYFLELWEKLRKRYPAFFIQFFLNVQRYKSHIFRILLPISPKFKKIKLYKINLNFSKIKSDFLFADAFLRL